MEFSTRVIESSALDGGRVELVEWQWPDFVEFERSERSLRVEMSLPPFATDASAWFPDIAPDKHCFMGTLVVRCPGVKIAGRCDGRLIRVVRFVFDQTETGAIMGDGVLSLGFLQGLLNIRSEALRSLLRLAHRELTNPVDRSAAALQSLFALVSIEVRRMFDRGAEAEACNRLAAWQFRRIRERIENGRTLPAVGELADLCGISPRHLHRQFLALTGKSVSAYIDACRVEQAKHLLAEPELPVKQVARQCGFDHANSFSRAFRRATGLSPREFRQRSAFATGAANDMRRKGVA